MNREIKFRAWDKELGMSAMTVSISFNTDGRISGCALFNQGLTQTILGNDQMVWMQFTGLKDKNGKEIYEGDLLKFSMGGDIQASPFKVKNMWDLRIGMECADSYMRIDPVFEIIGNVYENKKLLK